VLASCNAGCLLYTKAISQWDWRYSEHGVLCAGDEVVACRVLL
jgi:hypothetical protein